MRGTPPGHGPAARPGHARGGVLPDPSDARQQARLRALCREGLEIWRRFDAEVRHSTWHPFVPSDYDAMRETLGALRAPGLRFLEWGSAIGVITIMADLMGFEAYGIELDPSLVREARSLAARYQSKARFAAGSFLPDDYEWRPPSGDGRLGTVGQGPSAYAALGHPLEWFDVVFAYPWRGEEPLMRDLMAQRGGSHARLVLYGATDVSDGAAGAGRTRSSAPRSPRSPA